MVRSRVFARALLSYSALWEVSLGRLGRGDQPDGVDPPLAKGLNIQRQPGKCGRAEGGRSVVRRLGGSWGPRGSWLGARGRGCGLGVMDCGFWL